MKRALSLILVLAMVLCLVPFSAFAAEWNLNGDYQDGTVTFTETVLESSALYTAPDAGTVKFSLSNYSEGLEGVNIYIDGSEDPYVLDTEIEVTAGQKIDVTVASDSSLAGTVDISSTFMTLPGTEGNPLFLSNYNTTAIVPAGGEVWYNLRGGFGGQLVSVNQAFVDDGVNFSVYHKNSDTTSASDEASYDYTAEFTGVGSWWGDSDMIKITNNLDIPMYYVLSGEYPAGHQMNPESIWAGSDFEASIAAGSQGHYYTYTPYQDGTVTVNIEAADAEGNALGWFFVVNNQTAGTYGDNQYSNAESNVFTYDVSANDQVQIIVNTFDPANEYNAPAGTVKVNLTFTAAPVEVAEPEVAQFNGVNYTLSEALSLAAASAPTADNRAVVTLTDSVEVDYNVAIDPYVTLNIAGYTLTAPNVIGLSGSMINAAAPTASGCTDGGKIYVPTKNNMVMSAELHDGSTDGCKLLPIWNVDHYLFTNVKNEYDTIEDVSGQEDYANCTKCMLVLVRHIWSDSVVKTLINDKDQNVEENALTFTYEASWDYYGVIRVYQQYEMIGSYVDSATGSYYGGDTGEIDGLVDFTIQNQIVSDTGAIFYGNLFEVE